MIFKSLQGSSGACWARVVHSQVPVAGGAQRSTPPLQTLPLPLDESCSGCRPLALMVSPGFSGVPLGPGPQSVTRGWCCLISVPRVGGQQAEMPRQFLVLSLLLSIFIAFLSSFGIPGCLSLPTELPPLPESFVSHISWNTILIHLSFLFN